MARKTATATKDQPALFGDDRGHGAMHGANAVAATKAKPKQAVATVTKMQPSASAPSLIDQLKKISNGKDVALAREYLAMIEKLEDRQAARMFDERMLACQEQIPPIQRTSKNKHTGSWWAKLETISKTVDPIIRRHGFTLSYGMEASPLAEHYRVICDVSNSGCTRRYLADVGMDSKGPKGEGNKSLAQGSGSSITYARRFLKTMIFDIVIEGMDNDGNGSRADRVIDGEVMQPDRNEKVSAAQAAQLAKAIGECGVGVPAFLEKYDIEKVADLPAVKFTKAMTACANFQRDTKGGAQRG